jgi:hypothetical protein
MRPQACHTSAYTDSRRTAPRRASRLRIMLLATSALAALPITAAHAGDATWSAAPADGFFNNAANWDPGVPILGAATFGTSNIRDITVSQNNSLGGMTLNADAGDYTFTILGGGTLGFVGSSMFKTARASGS